MRFSRTRYSVGDRVVLDLAGVLEEFTHLPEPASSTSRPARSSRSGRRRLDQCAELAPPAAAEPGHVRIPGGWADEEVVLDSARRHRHRSGRPGHRSGGGRRGGSDLSSQWPARLLAEAVADYCEQYPDVPLQQKVVQGESADVLVAESAGAALTVVGSRGRGGFTGLVLRSTSQGVLHHATGTVAVLTRPRPVQVPLAHRNPRRRTWPGRRPRRPALSRSCTTA
jgi:nucleotide-binding universal stress UspA family protein